MYNPYCLVVVLYYEVGGKVLKCEDCIFKDTCNEYLIAKKFQR